MSLRGRRGTATARFIDGDGLNDTVDDLIIDGVIDVSWDWPFFRYARMTRPCFVESGELGCKCHHPLRVCTTFRGKILRCNWCNGFDGGDSRETR